MGILRRNCPHCPTDQVAFEVVAAHAQPNHGAPRWSCLGICGFCANPITFIAEQINNQVSGPPTTAQGDVEQHWRVLNLWPSRENHFAPPHTPQQVAKRFLEGEDAFKRRNWNSAVAMYRSALDIATKGMEGVPEKMTFFQRLEWLHDKNGITPDIKSWADHVRVEGNSALHDPEDFDESDAKALRFFTEMFLRYVFELPGAVREFRGEPDPNLA